MKTALAYYAMALDLTNGSNVHAMYGIQAIGHALGSVKGQNKLTEKVRSVRFAQTEARPSRDVLDGYLTSALLGLYRKRNW